MIESYWLITKYKRLNNTQMISHDIYWPAINQYSQVINITNCKTLPEILKKYKMAKHDASFYENLFKINFRDYKQRNSMKTISGVCLQRNTIAISCEIYRLVFLFCSRDLWLKHGNSTNTCVEADNWVLHIHVYCPANELDCGRLLQNTKEKAAECLINI